MWWGGPAAAASPGTVSPPSLTTHNDHHSVYISMWVHNLLWLMTQEGRRGGRAGVVEAEVGVRGARSSRLGVNEPSAPHYSQSSAPAPRPWAATRARHTLGAAQEAAALARA